MAASSEMPVSSSEVREDVVWLGGSSELVSLRCVRLQDASETHRRVSSGGLTAVAGDARSSGGGADSDSKLQVAVLHFDFKAFERASYLRSDDAIELWVRWHAIVPQERKAGSRKQYISVRIEVSFRSVCACACVLGRSFPSMLWSLVLLAWRSCRRPTTISPVLESGFAWTSCCFRTRSGTWILRSPRSSSGAGSRGLTRVACGVFARRGSRAFWRSFLAWATDAL